MANCVDLNTAGGIVVRLYAEELPISMGFL
jgi:hypothetical protein